MIERFRKITEVLYRGGAPSEKDVINLNKYLKINKIISLDKASGEAIKPICKKLGIEHVLIPLNGRKGPLLELFKHDIYELLMKGGPTFIHCAAGKDRTGFLSALFKCMYMDYTFDEAMDEAKSLGFGVGVNPFVIGQYTNLLRKACKQKEERTIATNQRSYKAHQDNRGSYLDQATQGSFAPFLSKTRQYPYDQVYNQLYDQSPTRSNYGDILDPYSENADPLDIPLVGQYSNNAGIRGVGPTENYGGFIFD